MKVWLCLLRITVMDTELIRQQLCLELVGLTGFLCCELILRKVTDCIGSSTYTCWTVNDDLTYTFCTVSVPSIDIYLHNVHICDLAFVAVNCKVLPLRIWIHPRLLRWHLAQLKWHGLIKGILDSQFARLKPLFTSRSLTAKGTALHGWVKQL